MPTPTGVGSEELRRGNLRAILQTVHRHGPTTRAELTKQLGLNRSTIGALTAELQSLGLVSEEAAAGGGRSGSGRPSHLVVPRADNVVAAVEVGVDRIAVAMVGLGGEIMERRTRTHQRGEHDVDHVVDVVAQMVEDVLAVPGDRRCQGIGVSVPGAVRTTDGMVRFAPNLGWVEEPFTALLGKRLGRPVSTGNDANLGVLAEHLRGAAVGFSDAVYLSASVGIGGGFLVGGRPLTGATGYAGEVGHLQVDSVGPVCRCGAVGCWETKVGENVLLRAAGRLSGGGPPAVAEVIAAAAAGRPGPVRRWPRSPTGAVWASAPSSTSSIPEVVVLGGCLAQVWRACEDRVNDAMSRSTMMTPREDVLIRSARLEDDAQLVGAAELAFAPVLDDPQTALVTA
ncbi:MAG: ROK family protein [Nocardioides sp.]|nr:ROK family protein [Nocardioides sp.]